MSRLGTWTLLVSLCLAGAAHAEDRNGAWLLQQLSARAHEESLRASKAGQAKHAKTWQDWADIYARASQNPPFARLTAEEMTQSNDKFCQEQLSKTTGPGRALYEASIEFWRALGRQLHAGKEPTAPFPKEMLVPVPGLAGTPWENTVAPASAADCRMLESEIKSCETQLTSLMHQNAMGGSNDGFYIVMRRHECNRLEELHLQACHR